MAFAPRAPEHVGNPAFRFGDDPTLLPVARTLAQIGDLVNGERENFRPIFVAAGLVEAWHWMTSDSFGALDANITDAAVKARILWEACVMSHRLTAEFPAEATRDMVALYLAAARAGIRRAWNFRTNDIINVQRFTIGADHQPQADGTLPGTARNPFTQAQFGTVLARIEPMYATASTDWLPQVIRLGIAAPVSAGVIMVFSGTHHFVDPHKQVFRAAVQEVMRDPVKTPGPLPKDTFEDVVAHKAAHPIDSSVLVWIARNTDIKDRFAAMEFNSAVVRVPAAYGVERGLSAIKQLIHEGAAALKNANVEINTGPIDALDAEIKALLTVTPTHPYAPADHTLAVEKVAAWSAQNGYGIAWIAGYFGAMQRELPKDLRSMTVLGSYAIKRATANFAYGASDGQRHFELYQRYERALARGGNLAGVGLFGAVAPAPLKAPE